jgi:AcrR family transcriptional regulator
MTSEPGLRERKKRETRERIRRTAVRLFLERGFEDVSVADVADAAGVSKMTVFNYFPAKEDMFFAGSERIFPDLAGAVRGREPDQSPVQALRAYVLAELESRAEWTGLHDGVADFTHLIWTSPTLLGGIGRRWQGLRAELVDALDEAAGLPPVREPDPSTGPALPSAGGGRDGPETLAALRATLVAAPDEPATDVSARRLVPRLMAGQVLAAVETLANANQLRQARGVSADAASEDALAAAELAFDLLELGLGDRPHPSP